MKRSNIIGLIGAILGLAVLVSIISWVLLGTSSVLLQGETDATSYKASSKISGRIDSMIVEEGQVVLQGELLYILSTPELDAKLEQAQGALSAAAAQESKALTGARIQEIQAARDVWMKAEAGLALAKKNQERAANLYRDGVVAKQKLDEADANLEAMNATTSAAQSQYNMALEGARREDITAAMALSKQAAGAVAEVESLRADAMIYSPTDGEVSSVIAREGELVGSGYPVVTVIDMADMWVAYNIKEDLMPKIKKGVKVMAYIPALGNEYEFYVDYIAVEAHFATWSATHTQGSFDLRTFKVKTRPTSNIPGLRPGMSAIIDWNKL